MIATVSHIHTPCDAIGADGDAHGIAKSCIKRCAVRRALQARSGQGGDRSSLKVECTDLLGLDIGNVQRALIGGQCGSPWFSESGIGSHTV